MCAMHSACYVPLTIGMVAEAAAQDKFRNVFQRLLNKTLPPCMGGRLRGHDD